jgi:hypothetical protein
MSDIETTLSELGSLFARTPDVTVRRDALNWDRYGINADNPASEWVVRHTFGVGGGSSHRDIPLGLFRPAVDRDEAYAAFKAWVSANVHK